MSRSHLDIGRQGEEAAFAFLKKAGYRIVKRNYKNALGEIDIIAYEQDTICFVEVKTRTTLSFGYPCEAITPRKQKQLIKVAISYLKQYNLLHTPARFDIVSVMIDSHQKSDINIIKDAFSLTQSTY